MLFRSVQSTTGGILFPDSTTQTTAVTAYTQPTTYGAIGTYTIGTRGSSYATPGSNYAATQVASGLSGTWKYMSAASILISDGGCTPNYSYMGLFLRIS